MPKGVFQNLQCPTCSKLIKSNAFNRHVNACSRVKETKAPVKRVAWNKGLTKEDPRVANLTIKVANSLRGKPGKPCSEKNKLLLSALQTSRLNTGYADGSRGQHGGYCKWFNVDGVNVQGTWELRAAQILSKWQKVGKIKSWQRCPYRIPYDLDSTTHIYSPDFLVKRVDGTEFILEIKGRQSLTDELKWSTAMKYYEFEVWRLKEIEQYEQEFDL